MGPTRIHLPSDRRDVRRWCYGDLTLRLADVVAVQTVGRHTSVALRTGPPVVIADRDTVQALRWALLVYNTRKNNKHARSP